MSPLETGLEAATLSRWCDTSSGGDLYAYRDMLIEGYANAVLERDLDDIVALGELIATVDDELRWRRMTSWKVQRNG